VKNRRIRMWPFKSKEQKEREEMILHVARELRTLYMRLELVRDYETVTLASIAEAEQKLTKLREEE